MLHDVIALGIISIHALREEGDAPPSGMPSSSTNFYPRPPRGGRHLSCGTTPAFGNFYPRPPRGGRPAEAAARCGDGYISIHALREEGDLSMYNIHPGYL